jgi:hypothetical protein
MILGELTEAWEDTETRFRNVTKSLAAVETAELANPWQEKQKLTQILDEQCTFHKETKRELQAFQSIKWGSKRDIIVHITAPLLVCLSSKRVPFAQTPKIKVIFLFMEVCKPMASLSMFHQRILASANEKLRANYLETLGGSLARNHHHSMLSNIRE